MKSNHCLRGPSSYPRRRQLYLFPGMATARRKPLEIGALVDAISTVLRRRMPHDRSAQLTLFDGKSTDEFEPKKRQSGGEP